MSEHSLQKQKSTYGSISASRCSFILILKTKKPKSGRYGWLPGALQGAHDLAGADAAGAGADGLGRAVDDGFHRLEVRQPASAGLDVRVRNFVSANWAFFAVSTNA